MRGAALAWIAAFGAGLFGQERPFVAETRLVQVPVTVTDSQEKNVDGLTAANFSVLEDGRPREFKLDTFGPGASPISLVIAVQTSGISMPAMVKIRRIGGMIQPLVVGRRGEAAVMGFDSDVQWLQGFTSDAETVQKVIRNLHTGAEMRSRMLDAVVESAGHLKDRPGRKVLFVISESKDRGSTAHLENAVEAVEREGIEVFAAPYSAQASSWIAKPEDLPPPSGGDYLAVFAELFRMGKTNHAHALADATGGAVYPFLRERAVEKAVERLGAEVHSQYILSFAPSAGRPGMHRIEVGLVNRPDARVARSRRAYWTE